jgi:hypothetical protein
VLVHSGSNVSHGLCGERINGMPVYGLSVIERMGLGAVYPRQDMNPASRYPLAPFEGVKDSQEMYREQFSGGVIGSL